ncbi:restriction endonuclease subunit S [Heyndrickxia coagulans]|uniref:restriction endonuclease subunit S n=1 Tax=Heyndrickxia coagulans TaxID=1398 RepID=UPI0010622E93|nr:restriction endonuclease subunit S [Heyndrickxia coagulans]
MEVNLLHKNKTENIPNGYKKTIVGIIPKDWQVKKFKEITDILKCGIASTPTYVEKGVPFLSSQNVKENKFILDKYNYVSEEFHEKLTKNAKPQRGDILYTRVGANFGKAAVVDFDWEFSIYVSLTLIRMKQGYNNYFYSYLLNSDKYVYNARRTVFQGGGVQNLNVKEVEKFDMVVPPYNEQEKIASILLTWDKAIELKEKLIEQKKKQKKGLMQKLLTGEVRLPGFDGEWKKIRLGTVIEECTEKTTVNNQYPVLTSSRKGIFLQEEYFSKQVASENNIGYKVVRKGDFTYRTMSDDGNFVFNQLEEYEVGIVSPAYAVFKATNINPLFLKSILNSYDFKKNILRNVQGGTRLSYKYSDLKNTVVKVPPKEEQSAIAEVIFNIENNLNLLEQELEALKQQKKGLMQLLLTGKVRVQV